MEKRGRKSSASLQVIRPANITAVERPAALEMLTDEQAGVWGKVVNRMPAEWFRDETHELLAQYCRHAVSVRRVAELIESLLSDEEESGNWLSEYNRLLIMQEREGRALSSLATRMRISQHSQYEKDKKRGSSLKPPHQS